MIVRQTHEAKQREAERVEAARRRASRALAWTDVIDRRRSGYATDETPMLATAEVAECACPEYCERDHEND